MSTQVQFVTLRFLRDGMRRLLPNTQAVLLALTLIVSFVLIYSLSDLLMPVFVSIVLAYLLEGIIRKVESMKISRLVAVYLVFLSFVVGLGFLLFFLLPIVSEQAMELVQQIPSILSQAQTEIMRLSKLYPQFFSEKKIQQFMPLAQKELLSYAQNLLSVSAASVVGLVSVMIYLFLVPMMVFFFLKDKELLVSWFIQFMPSERHLTVHVWEEIDEQIGNYVHGKFAEVFILWFVSFVTYAALGLNYAMLLAVFMGLQVIIPYIGATLVTVPVLGVAYFQWGLSGDDFMYVVVAYSIIQALDGVILVPLLFSEAVNLHAVAIIIAILFFGGLWGFWGVFLAIPLATVVKAVLNSWPRIGTTGNFNANF
ncbi:MAG: AI-2E family transporter [Methylococcaceae bacterium]|nr:AI-2E family transporter [Methylococcaceae bacterium]